MLYRVDVRPRCISGGDRAWIEREERRRRDIPPAKYGNGCPENGTGIIDFRGVPLASSTSKVSYKQTEQGHIGFISESEDLVDQYTDHRPFAPTIGEIHLLSWYDSRMTPLSNRYYRR